MNLFFNSKCASTLFVATTVFFYGCISECAINCPDECIPIRFYLEQDGINILKRSDFQIDTLFVETLSPNIKSPPLIEIKKDFFKMVVCQNSSYRFNLNDTIIIEIAATLDTLMVDECCPYYAASSLKFNGQEFCKNGLCAGGVFDID